MNHFNLVCASLCCMLISVLGSYCPYAKCNCYEDTIDCGSRELTELPELIPVSETQPQLLDVHNNQLTTIPDGALPPGLYGIDFQQNPIRTIDDNAFRDIANNLTDLSFSLALFTDLPKALLQVKRLRYLTIFDMQISNWDIDTVKHIGLTLETLILINTSLTSWPTWISYMPHLGTLELSYMTFQVPDDALDNQVDTLFSVNFQNCNLTEIPNAMSKLKHLQNLVLDHNDIKNVTSLPNSPNLTMLSLDDNKVSDSGQLSEGLRTVSGTLTTLQLRGNRLQSLPDLSAMVKLDSLYLNQNGISSIGSGKVPPFLTYIELDNNNLQSLYFFMQTGVHLIILRFDSNLILDIRGVDIPASVSDMSIMYNRITALTDTSFPVNSTMGSLSLDFNPISKIATSAFVNLKNLLYLSMVGTQLARLPLALNALTNLRTVSLDQNVHLVCTCEEKSLRDWFLSLAINGDCGITSIEYFFQFMSEQCPD